MSNKKDQVGEPSPGLPIFRFADDRQERIHKRLSIIGEGAAEFFYDACRLMAAQPQFKSTTHVVAHLLREAESCLRDVLEPLSGEEFKKGEPDRHKRGIRAVLRVLGILETDPIGNLWLALAGKTNDWGLNKRAHRDSLAPARPIDAEFLKFWDSVQAVFDKVLDRFEARYLEIHRVLDEYVGITSPTVENARWLKQHVPDTQVAMSDLFYRLRSPAWIDCLDKAGFFKRPYPPISDEEGRVSHLSWPQSRFLARMAVSDSIAVKQTITSILLNTDSDNISIHADSIDAALAMPGNLASQLAEKERVWIEKQSQVFGSYPDKIGKLLEHLCHEKEEKAALTLLAAAMKIDPDPKESDAEDPYRFRYLRPRTKINDWEYRVILFAALPALVASAPLETLSQFCDALDRAVELSLHPHDRDRPEDHSDGWREHIDSSSRDGIENVLVSAVRNVTKKILDANPELEIEVIRIIESHEWLIFSRFGFYVLRLYPVAELVIPRLVNKANYDRRGLLNEYMELAKSNFHVLDAAQQNEILGWMCKDDDIESTRKSLEDFYGGSWPDEKVGRFLIEQRLRRFDPLKDVLSEDWRRKYEEWTAIARPSQQIPVAEEPIIAAFQSPKSREDLSEMSVEDIVAFLKEWNPSESSARSGELTREALARDLTPTVFERAETFARLADAFIGLAPVYVRAVLAGLKTAADAYVRFSWDSPIRLCRWALEQGSYEGDQSAPSDGNVSPRGWREVLELISSGFDPKASEIQYELRSEVWSLLEILLNNQDPTGETEAARNEETDWFYWGVNSVRGGALQTVIRYVLWVKRHLDKTNNVSGAAVTLANIPEVRVVLERHLDLTSERSLGIRAIYGRWVPWLCWLDSSWVSQNLNRIFPLNEGDERFYKVAWESYIGWNEPHAFVVPVLRGEYERAIERIGAWSYREGSSRPNPDESLAGHIIGLYVRGSFGLGAGDLVAKFFEKASSSLRAYATWSLGSGLRQTKETIVHELLERIEEFWAWRLDRAKLGESDPDELQQFGWILISRKLDDAWCLVALRDTLRLSQKINPDTQVVELLANVAPTHLAAAVESLSMILRNTTEEWKISYWGGHIRTILSAALQGENDQIVDSAVDAVNRLGAGGNTEFRDLLPPRAVKYFAYGSNMLLRRLRKRVPSARISSITSLSRHSLKFHKASEDKDGNRSGRCNAYFTGRDEDVVWGVVFDIDRKEKPNLEAAEVGYVEQPLTLRSADKELLGFMYAVANPNLLDESLRPYDWYKALVVTGAKEHNLPVVYVKELEGVESVNDPNAVRAERNRKLLN